MRSPPRRERSSTGGRPGHCRYANPRARGHGGRIRELSKRDQRCDCAEEGRARAAGSGTVRRISKGDFLIRRVLIAIHDFPSNDIIRGSPGRVCGLYLFEVSGARLWVNGRVTSIGRPCAAYGNREAARGRIRGEAVEDEEENEKSRKEHHESAGGG